MTNSTEITVFSNPCSFICTSERGGCDYRRELFTLWGKCGPEVEISIDWKEGLKKQDMLYRKPVLFQNSSRSFCSIASFNPHIFLLEPIWGEQQRNNTITMKINFVLTVYKT
jgi:hypothetical protein